MNHSDEATRTDEMVLKGALKALCLCKPFQEARLRFPVKRGLYAIYGEATTWNELGLAGHDKRPLYVGKSETSLVSRDLDTHFFVEENWADKNTSPTGSSTLRRSLAALLGYQASHRNPNAPLDKYASMYGLTPEGDVKLGKWMQSRLGLAFWTSLDPVNLRDLENLIKTTWLPPLNLDIETQWKALVRAERAKLAAQIRFSTI